MNKSLLQNATKGLAGAVALAGGSQAYGSVVTVTAPTPIAASSASTPVTEFLDVNGDGIPDFQLTVGVYTNGTSIATAYAGIAGAYQATTAFSFENAVVGYSTAYGNYASRLAAGTSIGPSSTFVAGSYLTILASRFNGKSYGALRTAGNVGFEFEAADGLHYGYINLKATVTGTGSTSVANYTASLAFTRVAYETTPNTPILAGALASVPEPTSLAALAFGAAGTLGAAAYRRKKAGQPVA